MAPVRRGKSYTFGCTTHESPGRARLAEVCHHRVLVAAWFRARPTGRREPTSAGNEPGDDLPEGAPASDARGPGPAEVLRHYAEYLSPCPVAVATAWPAAAESSPAHAPARQRHFSRGAIAPGPRPARHRGPGGLSRHHGPGAGPSIHAARAPHAVGGVPTLAGPISPDGASGRAPGSSVRRTPAGHCPGHRWPRQRAGQARDDRSASSRRRAPARLPLTPGALRNVHWVMLPSANLRDWSKHRAMGAGRHCVRRGPRQRCRVNPPTSRHPFYSSSCTDLPPNVSRPLNSVRRHAQTEPPQRHCRGTRRTAAPEPCGWPDGESRASRPFPRPGRIGRAGARAGLLASDSR